MKEKQGLSKQGAAPDGHCAALNPYTTELGR